MTTNHVKTIVDDFLTKLGDLEMPPLVIGNLKKLADSGHLMQQAELADLTPKLVSLASRVQP